MLIAWVSDAAASWPKGWLVSSEYRASEPIIWRIEPEPSHA